MRLILTAIILTMLAQPVLASEIYVCNIKTLVNVSKDGVSEHTGGQFAMRVEKDQYVKFGEDSFFDGLTMDIELDALVPSGSDSNFSAVKNMMNTTIAVAIFARPDFYYTMPGLTIISLHATCEIL